ncbi:MAG: hypothetical protein OEW46_05085 [Actinomycetota bacterium]|nr:hypothetical protein [Actinomycetota bacterium]
MEEQAGTPRRSVFRRLEQHDDEPLMTSSEHRISASLRRSIDGQLEEGLRALEEQATDLMREIAAEIWRASGNDMRPEQERIVSLLSRDQTIKTLIAANEERFQSIALRSARVEDTVNEVAENGRTSRHAIEASLVAIREIADSPTLHGVEGIRTQLEQVEHHIAAALATMQDRDRAIIETVARQVRDHGQLLTEETTKVIGAIDAYVQTGAEAMGTLSQRVEEHAQAFAEHDGTISQTVADRVAAELAPVAQQLEMLAEQVGLHGRDQEQVRAAIERLVESRIMGVAQLIRADSEALQRLIEERTEVQTDTIRETVDWRMAAFAERMDEKLGSVATEITATVGETLGSTVERLNTGVGAIDGIDSMIAEGQTAAEERMLAHIDDRMTAIARLIRSDNQALASTMREHRMITPSEPLDAELVRQTLRAIKELQAGLASDMQNDVDVKIHSISDQLHQETQSTTESIVKVAEVLGEKIDRLTVRVDEGVGSDMQVVIDRMTDAIQAMSTARRSA